MLATSLGDVGARLPRINDEVRVATIGIISAGSDAQRISRLGTVSGVGVVYLRRVAGNVASIGISAQKNAAGVKRLRSALANNPVTRAALAARNVPLHRVVAARIVAGNSIRVYVL
jgi:hypothetical protein